MPKKFLFLLVFIQILLVSTAAMSAQPIDAPANFSLSGSSIYLTATYKNLRGSTVSVGIDPNPIPVNGSIIFETIERATGVFTGRFENIEASTTLDTAALGTIPITLELNANSVSGVFLWAAEKVIFDTSSINLTIEVKGTQFPIPLNNIKFPATFTNNQISIQIETDQQVEYSGLSLDFHISMDIIANLQDSPSTAPWISLHTDQTSYTTGQVLQLLASLGNPGAAQPVDIYLCIHTPDDRYLFFPAWTETISPALTNWTFPSGSTFMDVVLINSSLPSQSPPVSHQGQYQFLAGITVPGTFNFIGDIVSTDFTFNNAAGTNMYDGHWYGTGGSAVPGGDCPGLASVVMDISNSQIVDGEAVDENDESYILTGHIDQAGNIINGQLWEEYQNSRILQGTFTGTLNGTSGSGTWQDSYGCYGTFSIQKQQ